MVMENLYLSQVPDGVEDLAVVMLKNLLVNFKVENISSGFLTYKTSGNWKEVSALDCVGTSYVLLRSFILLNNVRMKVLDWCMQHPGVIMSFLQMYFSQGQTFRVVVSCSSKEIGKYKEKIHLLEKILKGNGAKINTGHPDYEIRILEIENIGYVGVRISGKPGDIDDLQKNSIRKDVASYMIHMSNPSSNDVFLDPMGGAGIIPLLRSKMPYKEIYVADVKTNTLLKKIKKLKLSLRDFTIIESDIVKLPSVISQPVNKLVTDPPWGYIESMSDINRFYQEMFKSFDKLLVKDGILVLISPHIKLVKTCVSKSKKTFVIKDIIKIKVSGAETYIYKIKKGL